MIDDEPATELEMLRMLDNRYAMAVPHGERYIEYRHDDGSWRVERSDDEGDLEDVFTGDDEASALRYAINANKALLPPEPTAEEAD